jgi:hypothetical protein
MAGKSSRFPNMKPKWMQTHPMTNRFMVIESILGLNLDYFEKIYFTVLQEHQEKYQFLTALEEELEEFNLGDKCKIVFLDFPTSCQSETVYQTVVKENIEGFIFIKDSDGYYKTEIQEAVNQVAYFDLNEMDDINARTKSYIQLDTNNVITNIVEKKVISPTFSVGGYGFQDAKEFCVAYESLTDTEGECYISHVIFEMMLNSSLFYGLKTSDFKDWGTLKAWNEYKSQYKCLFLDIDGTLVENSSVHFPPYVGNAAPLIQNIEKIREMFESKKTYIVLTTSRPEYTRSITEEELELKQIPYHQLIMGLPHCSRIVVNDYANTNPYPSCSAINIPRNSDTLKEVLS